MSMQLKEICDLQAEFDKQVSISGRSFFVDINENNLSELEHLTVCMMGELGEFCNILKKVTRGDNELDDVKPDLSEEFVDTFIYMIKISNQFGIDLEKGFLEKLEKNKHRFKGL